jgi:hypothetical protein
VLARERQPVERLGGEIETMAHLTQAAVALGIGMAVASAANAGVVTFASDAAFNSYASSGAFTKTFGGNVRWGNGGGSGDWEYAIVNAGDTPIGGVGQRAWGATNTHRVTFSFDGSSSATLALGGIGSLTRAVPGDPSVLFARVRDSESQFSNLKDIQIDLSYNGVGVDYSFNLLTGDANAEYWGVADANLRFGFTLTAEATLVGPRTAGSDPMYQFKVGVPTPGPMALLAIGGLVAGRRRR